MKYKTGFKLDWLEMLLVLLMFFLAGFFVSGDSENKFLFAGMLILSSGILVIKKRVKIPVK